MPNMATCRTSFMPLVALLCLAWLPLALAMRPDRIAQLRQDTIEMFYHGYDNYMDLAFPEDEVCPHNMPWQSTECGHPLADSSCASSCDRSRALL